MHKVYKNSCEISTLQELPLKTPLCKPAAGPLAKLMGFRKGFTAETIKTWQLCGIPRYLTYAAAMD